MPLRLVSRDPGFEAAFATLLAMKREVSEDVDEAVRAIIAAVIASGDDALVDFTSRFDRLSLTPDRLRVGTAEIEAAASACEPAALAALRLAAERIHAFHLLQRPTDLRFTDAIGVELGWRWTAIES